MTRILITGITGFVGGYLASRLVETPDMIVSGIDRDPDRLLPPLSGRVTCFSGDLQSEAFVFQVLQQVKPDHIYHLAGQPFVPYAWADPWPTFALNILPQLNLLKGLVTLNIPARFLSITSSKVYGAPQFATSITEDTPLLPTDPYGLSKITQDLMARLYQQTYNLPVLCVRPFNHIGPRQNANFVTAAFARQIAMAEVGLAEGVVKAGNLNASRDFTDVRDVIEAYILLMNKGKPGEVYNVASGKLVIIQHILNMLIGFSRVPIRIETDTTLLRPVDPHTPYGDISKIYHAVGWQPVIPLEQTLRDILDYWRDVVANHPERL